MRRGERTRCSRTAGDRGAEEEETDDETGTAREETRGIDAVDGRGAARAGGPRGAGRAGRATEEGVETEDAAASRAAGQEAKAAAAVTAPGKTR